MLYISPSLVANLDASGNLGRLENAHIGYRTITSNSTVTASSQAPGFPANAVRHPLTYERWQPVSVPATLTIDAGSLVAADYVGIAAHTIGSAGATVLIECSDDGVSWTLLAEIAPENDNAIMALFEPVLARYWRITIDKVAEIGVVYVERCLKMPRGVYEGHAPGVLSRDTKIMPSRSVAGQFLGRSVVRQGYATEYSWQYLDPVWYRQHFDPFVESATKHPFFIAWKPSRYPDEVLYAWTDRDITPRYMGMASKMMQVRIDVEAVK